MSRKNVRISLMDQKLPIIDSCSQKLDHEASQPEDGNIVVASPPSVATKATQMDKAKSPGHAIGEELAAEYTRPKLIMKLKLKNSANLAMEGIEDTSDDTGLDRKRLFSDMAKDVKSKIDQLLKYEDSIHNNAIEQRALAKTLERRLHRAEQRASQAEKDAATARTERDDTLADAFEARRQLELSQHDSCLYQESVSSKEETIVRLRAALKISRSSCEKMRRESLDKSLKLTNERISLTKLGTAAREVTGECKWMTEKNHAPGGKTMDELRRLTK